MTRCLIALIIVLVLSVNSFAELFMNFKPYESLTEIKAKYPNATFTQIHPAWAKKDDIMFALEGDGLGGAIVLKLVDDHEFYYDFCEPPAMKQRKICIDRFTNEENMYLLSLVRWIPTSNIPLKKLISKYGKPTFITDEVFSNYAKWEKRKIFALLNDNKTIVKHIDYAFTDDEIKKEVALR